MIKVMLAIMTAASVVTGLIFLHSGEQSPADFSGLWRMQETDYEYRHVFQNCFIEITQTGDRIQVRAWSTERDWRCTGRGEVSGNECRFRWGGGVKGWKGATTLKLVGNKLYGVYTKDGPRTDIMYCMGEKKQASD